MKKFSCKSVKPKATNKRHSSTLKRAIARNQPVDSNHALLQLTMLQQLEPRYLFDAALGAELVAAVNNHAITQAVDLDLTEVDSSMSADQTVDLFIAEESMLDDGSLSDDSIDYKFDSSSKVMDYEYSYINSNTTSNSELMDYYSFDKSLVKELIFVDPAISNYAELLDDANLNKLFTGELEVVVLDSEHSGIKQISEHLKNYNGQLNTLHLVADGEPGQLKIGNDTLDLSNISEHYDNLSTWGFSLSVGAELLLYGNHAGDGAVGKKLTNNIQSVIDTNIGGKMAYDVPAEINGEWFVDKSDKLLANSSYNTKVLSGYQNIIVADGVDDSLFIEQIHSTPDYISLEKNSSDLIEQNDYAQANNLGDEIVAQINQSVINSEEKLNLDEKSQSYYFNLSADSINNSSFESINENISFQNLQGAHTSSLSNQATHDLITSNSNSNSNGNNSSSAIIVKDVFIDTNNQVQSELDEVHTISNSTTGTVYIDNLQAGTDIYNADLATIQYYDYSDSATEVVFVDGAVDNYQDLIEGIDQDKIASGDIEVVILDTERSGVEQINSFLKHYENQITTTHIVSHGDVAELRLGSDILNYDSLANFQDLLSSWGDGLSSGADILFYGCNVAEGDLGQQFVEDLHAITQADIAASSDVTGHQSLGGDWDIEVNIGEIDSSVVFNAQATSSYYGALAVFTVTSVADYVPSTDGSTQITGTLRQAIELADDTPEHDTIQIDDSLNGQTITLVNANFQITTPMTITGNFTPGEETNASLFTKIDASAAVGGVTLDIFQSADTYTYDGGDVFVFFGADTGSITGAENTIFENLWLENASDDFLVITSNNITVKNSYFTQTPGDAIQFEGGADSNYTNVLIDNNTFFNVYDDTVFDNSTNGVGFTFSNNNVTTNNAPSGEGIVTWDIDGNDIPVITNNIITGKINAIVMLEGDATVSNNLIYDNTDMVVIDGGSSYNTYVSNGLDTSPSIDQVTFTSADTVTIEGSFVGFSGTTYTVEVFGDDATVGNNSQAQVKLFEIVATTDGAGNLSFTEAGFLLTGHGITVNSITAIATESTAGNSFRPSTLFSSAFDIRNIVPTANNNVTAPIIEDSGSYTSTGNLITDSPSDSDSDTTYPRFDTISITQIESSVTTSNSPGNIVGTYGTLNWNAAGGYTYTLNNSNTVVQNLANGQQVDDVFTYTLTDTQNASDTATLTVNITGANDDVLVISAVDTGAVTEDGVLQASGTVEFTDVDLTDNHIVTSALQSTNYTTALGTFVAVETTDTTGSGTGGLVNWTYNLNNSLAQQLAQGQVVTETYTITINDQNGDLVTQNVSITITGANDEVLVTSAVTSGTVEEDGTSQASGTVGFSDVDLTDNHLVTSALKSTNYSSASMGTFSVVETTDTTGTGTGGLASWTYNIDNIAAQQLADGQIVQETYTITVNDQNGDTVTQDVSVTITGVNDSPVVDNGIANQTVAEDSAFNFVIPTDAFSDADLADSLNYNVKLTNNNPLPAWLSFNTITNTLSGTPANSDVGTYNIRVTATDGQGVSVSDDFSLVVNNTNDAPVAVDDINSLDKFASSVMGNMLTDGVNDSDVDVGDALSIQQVNGVTNGVTGVTGVYGSLNWDSSTGAYTYNLDNGNADIQNLSSADSLNETFTYTLRDLAGATDTATLVITITGSNNAPVIISADDSASLTENTDVSASGFIDVEDIDRTDIVTTVLSYNQGDNTGSYGGIFNGAGLLEIDPIKVIGSEDISGTLTWDFNQLENQQFNFLAAGETLTLNYKLTFEDNNNASVNQAIAITVTGVNDAPVIGGVTSDNTMTEETVVNSQVSRTLTITDADDNQNQFQAVSTTGTYGNFALAANGNWSYVRNSTNLQGLDLGDTVTDSFTATSSDGSGTTTVTITINGLNDAPTVDAGINNQTVAQDSLFSLSVPANAFNDVDADNNFTYTASLANNNALPSWLNFNGTSFSGTPTNDDVGSVRIKLTATDSHNVSVSTEFDLVVTNVNDAPVAVNDINTMSKDDSNVSGNLLTDGVDDSDIDVGDVLSIKQVDGVTNGAAGISGSFGALTWNASTGAYTYVLDSGNSSVQNLSSADTITDVFTYTLRDIANATDTATLSITISGTNNAPTITAANSSASLTENSNISESGTISVEDIDSSNVVTSSFITGTNTGTYSGPYDGSTLFSISPPQVIPAGQTTGTLTWNFNQSAAESFDFLGLNETLIFNYTVTFSDDSSASVSQAVTIAVTGINDVPAVGVADSAGSVSEITDGALGENDDLLFDFGSVAFTDLDLSDVHTITSSLVSATDASNNPVTQRGVFTTTLVDVSTNDGVGSVDWDFEVSDSELDDLAEGEVITQIYNIAINDNKGGTGNQQVTITLNGTNDAPIVSTSANTGSVTELADGAAGENASSLTDTGEISFSEVDLADGHTVSTSFVSATDVTSGNSVAQKGVLNALVGNPATNIGNGSITWNFAVADSALDDLAQGQAITEVYNVTVDDGKGGTDTTQVTVTLNGSNDAPVIDSFDAPFGVIELPDGDVGENSNALFDFGSIFFTDVDITDNHTVTSNFVSATDSLGNTVAEKGTMVAFFFDPEIIDWDFEVSDAELDNLSEGETITQVYNIILSDGKGGTATQQLSIDITGSNDAPVISAANDSASVTEIADGTLGEGTDSFYEFGTIDFTDADLADSHTPTFSFVSATDSLTNGSVAQRGIFTVSPGDTATGDGAGNVDWDFEIIDSALDDLAQGQTITQLYDVTVSDDQGGSNTQRVTITLNGANDAPIISSTGNTGAVTEIVDNAAGENVDTLFELGSLDFTDIDLADSHAVSASFISATDSINGSVSERGLFTVSIGDAASGDGAGSVDWNFEVNDSDIDDLASGQTITQTYNVTVTDDKGGIGTQQVTITINGTNDAPVISSSENTGAVIEVADGVVGENSDTLFDFGSIDFTDVDLSDSHTITTSTISATDSINGAVTARGTFTASLDDSVPGDGISSVAWDFEVNDSVVDDLAAGQTLTQIYRVTVNDAKSGVFTEDVTVTITGTNDLPVVTIVDNTGSITEITDGAAGEGVDTLYEFGSIQFTDSDLPDIHSVTHDFVSAIDSINGSVAQLGVFEASLFDASTAGWDFEVADSAIDNLTRDQVVTQTYNVNINDGQGGIRTQQVTITITGTNDLPVIGIADNSGSVTEITDDALGENINTLNDSGTIAFTDVDLSDSHTVTSSLVSATDSVNGSVTARGTFSPSVVDISTGDGVGSVGWNFDVADSALDDLAQGQTITQVYNVTIEDSQGGSDTQQVTVTLNGVNDAPDIGRSDNAVTVTEITDGGAGENTTTLSESGVIDFGDADLLDGHTVSFSLVSVSDSINGNVAQRGNFTPLITNISTGDASGEVTWNFSIDDSALEDLAVGQTIRQLYDVTIDDGKGGTDTQRITITLAGSNDAPTAINDTSTVSRDDLTITGNMLTDGSADNDVDTNDILSIQAIGAETNDTVNIIGTYGTLDWDSTTGDYTYTIDQSNATVLALTSSDSIDDVFTYTLTDASGATDTATLTVSITGTNNAPTITAATTTASLTEDTIVSATGTIDVEDIDEGDIVTSSLVTAANSGSYTGTFDGSGLFTIAPTEVISNIQTTGTLTWNFNQPQTESFDFLAVGETLIFNQTVTFEDDISASASQPVTITVTGINDNPDITTGDSTAAITEITDGAAGENGDNLFALGTLNFTDLDLSDGHSLTSSLVSATDSVNGSVAELGAFSAVINDVSTGDGAGTIDWDFEVSDSALDSLASGQTVTQTYNVTINDGNGGTAFQLVTITLNGTNDVPVVGAVDNAGAVTEITDNAIGENVDTLFEFGSVAFTDVDLADSHTVTASLVSATDSANGAVSERGTFAVSLGDAATGDGAGSVDWDFEVADSVLDDLAAGQNIVQVYDVTLNDGQGGQFTQQVTITINGANDAPVVGTVDNTGAVTEITDNAAGENIDSLIDFGSIDFADVDLTDGHTVTFGLVSATDSVNGAVAQRGTFTAVLADVSTGDGSGSIDWDFEVVDSALDDLAAGQTITQIYNVTINDGKGGSTTEQVTLTLTGTNDIPVITTVDNTGAVTEITDNATGENTDNLFDFGTVDFTDVDLSDSHTVTASLVSAIDSLNGAVTARGIFTPVIGDLATGDGAGSIDWDYEVADSALDDLAAGQTITQIYNVTIDDGNGGTATQQVTITLNGTNDVPVVGTVDNAAVITEIADNAAGENVDSLFEFGSVDFTDVDLADSHTVTASLVSATDSLNGSISERGRFTVAVGDAATGDGAGSIDWDFEVADSALDDLAAGQTITQVYDVIVNDGKAGQFTEQVTITMTGTNDAPVIATSDNNGAVTEIADNAIGENVDSLFDFGTVDFTDVDLTDAHTVSFSLVSAIDSINGTVAQRGTFNAALADASTGDGAGSVDWDYEVADSALDDLSAGQTITQIYNVTIDDGKGGTATEQVTVTITGTNDTAVITNADNAGAVTEVIDSAPGENTDTLFDFGSIEFTDVDLLDSHTVSTSLVSATDSINGSVAARGTLTSAITDVATTDGNGTVDWDFEVIDSALDDLAAGQTLTQVYNVSIDDGQGGIATVQVTITITGTNDAPVITAGDDSGAVSEIADNAAGENIDTLFEFGNVDFIDVDLSDSHTVTTSLVSATDSLNGAVTGRGTLTASVIDQATGDGTGSVGWDFEVADSALDNMSAGQVITQIYDVTVDDGNGGTATKQVTLTLTGANDAPVATVNTATISEDGTNVTGNFINDATADSDADVNDVLTIKQVQFDVSTQADGVAGLDGVYGVLNWDSATGQYTYTVNSTDPTVQALQDGQNVTDVFTYTLQDDQGATSTADLTVTITGARDSVVSLSLSSATIDESAGSANLRIQIEGDTFDQDVTIGYTIGGTAVNGVSGDYQLAANAIITAGATFVDVPIVINNDNVIEGDETLTIELTSITPLPTGNVTIANNGTQLASAIIVDDDIANISVTVDDVSLDETVPETATFTFTIADGKVAQVPIIINYTISGPATLETTDFIDSGTTGNFTGSVTIPAGQTNGSITIEAVVDGVIEGTENLTITIDSITPVNITSGTGNIASTNITDSDAIVVNVTADDSSLGADTSSIAALISDPGDDGLISLREAIIAANNTDGEDTLVFDGPGTITLIGSNLPIITETLIIDGASTPTYTNTPVVTVDGVAGSDIFTIQGAEAIGTTITALNLIDADGGINNSAENVILNNNTISGMTVTGITNTGLTATISGNTVSSSTTGINTSGDGATLSGNTVSLNTGTGIISSGSTDTLSNNTMNSNNIGLDSSGPDAIIDNNTTNSNTISGIVSSGLSADITNNTVESNATGIDSRGDDALIDNNNLTANTGTNIISTGEDGADGDSNGAVITNNIINGDDISSVGIDAAGDFAVIQSNTISGINTSGINSSGQNATIGGLISVNGNNVSDNNGNAIVSTGINADIESNITSNNTGTGIDSQGEGAFVLGNTANSNNIGIDSSGADAFINNNITNNNTIAGIISSGNNVSITSNTADNNATGIDSRGDDALIDDNNLTGNTGTNILSTGGDGADGDSNGAVITNNTIDGDNVSVIGIDSSGDSAVIQTNDVSGVNTTGILTSGPDAVVGGSGAGEGNVVSNNNGDGIDSTGINVDIINNTTSDNDGTGIVSQALGAKITGNSSNSNVIGIDSSGPDVVIDNNVTNDNTIAGIISSGTNVDITNNIANNNNIGIDSRSDDADILNNTASNNTTDGILSTGDDADITSNTVASNGDDGIDSGGNNAVITNNTATGNTDAGIESSGANATISNNNPVSGNDTGISSTGTGATIDTNTVQNNTGDGINSTGTGVAVTNNTVDSNTGDGINTSGSNATIDNNIIDNNGGDGINSSGASAAITDNTSTNNTGDGILSTGDAATISANTTTGNGDDGIDSQGPDANILGNTASNNTDDGIVSSGANATIDNNITDGNTGDGIDSSGTPAAIINNTSTNNTGDGVLSTGGSATISANTTTGNGDDGIDSQGADANISGNTASNNTDDGIVSSGTNATIDNNITDGNTGDGIDSSGTPAAITNNTSTNNTGDGVLSTGGSATISANTTTGNGDDGIDSQGADANISGNTASNNTDDGIVSSGANATIDNNITDGNTGDGIDSSGTPAAITNNTSTNNAGDGVLSTGGSATISANTTTGNGDDGIDSQGADANISGNTASNNTDDGIVSSGANATIENNITDGNTGDGIDSSGTPAAITNNTSTNNTGDGVLSTGDDATITGNNTTGNGDDGIDSQGANANISGNTSSGNTDDGIVSSGPDATIDGNSTDGNGGDGIESSGTDANITNNSSTNNTGSGISSTGSGATITDNNPITGNTTGITSTGPNSVVNNNTSYGNTTEPQLTVTGTGSTSFGNVTTEPGTSLAIINVDVTNEIVSTLPDIYVAPKNAFIITIGDTFNPLLSSSQSSIDLIPPVFDPDRSKNIEPETVESELLNPTILELTEPQEQTTKQKEQPRSRPVVTPKLDLDASGIPVAADAQQQSKLGTVVDLDDSELQVEAEEDQQTDNKEKATDAAQTDVKEEPKDLNNKKDNGEEKAKQVAPNINNEIDKQAALGETNNLDVEAKDSSTLINPVSVIQNQVIPQVDVSSPVITNNPDVGNVEQQNEVTSEVSSGEANNKYQLADSVGALVESAGGPVVLASVGAGAVIAGTALSYASATSTVVAGKSAGDVSAITKGDS